MLNKLKIILLCSALLVFCSIGVVIAQEATDTATTVDQQTVQTITEEPAITAQDLGVSDPTLLPDSKFYFLKSWQRFIKSTFTFGQVNKAELNLKIASEKLLEAKKLAEKTNNPQILDKATEQYNKKIEQIQNNIAKFKENASTSPKVAKFVAKYINQQALHEKILDKLATKVPTSTLEKIEAAQKKHLEKFKDVMEKVGNKEQVKAAKEKIDNLKSKIEEKIKNRLENKKQKNTTSTNATTTQKYKDCVCTEVYGPVCGADGKTYGNPCKAKCQNIEIVSQGPCKGNATSTNPKIIGGQKDEHGCLIAAGYSWCEAKQKCLRTWEEKCEATTTNAATQ